MNLIQFLKQVDQSVSRLSKNELGKFIHETARTLPEYQRDMFLGKLNAVGKRKPEEPVSPPISDFGTEALRQKIAQLEQDLTQIEDGQLCPVGFLNEEYDDWYNSSADEFLFEDPENVTDILSEACRLIHQCVDQELYPEGFHLFTQLAKLTITINGDYEEYCDPEMPFYDFIDAVHLDICQKDLVLDGLYLAYQAVPMPNRPEVLFAIIQDACCRDISLEALMQKGEIDLPEWDTFLTQWIEYLGRQNNSLSKKLLSEAAILQDSPEQFLESARKFADLHPEMYEQYLRQGLNGQEDKKMLATGQEALRVISPQFTIRSHAALLTATYALRLNKRETAENCWLEAFRSDTNEVNYLRLRLESLDFSLYQEETSRIICAAHKTMETPYAFVPDNSGKNRITSNTYYGLVFFSGNFRQVIQEAMSAKDALGWSSTFMKYGFALFLPYLYSGDSLESGCRAMCKSAAKHSNFHSKSYRAGLSRPTEPDDGQLFWQCFFRWKKTVSISPEEAEQIIQKFQDMITMRVKGIMESNQRNYYGECAAFIAALGEVKESRGERNGKARLMEYYKTMYSRRRAFHEELRKFGMGK